MCPPNGRRRVRSRHRWRSVEAMQATWRQPVAEAVVCSRATSPGGGSGRGDRGQPRRARCAGCRGRPAACRPTRPGGHRRDVARRVGGRIWSEDRSDDERGEGRRMRLTRARGGRPAGVRALEPAFSQVSDVLMAEDRGFEPLRAVNPTRFPSERHRPLGESSAEESTRRSTGRRNQDETRARRRRGPPRTR